MTNPYQGLFDQAAIGAGEQTDEDVMGMLERVATKEPTEVIKRFLACDLSRDDKLALGHLIMLAMKTAMKIHREEGR